MSECFTITYHGEGQLLVQDVFDKQAKKDIVNKPQLTRIKKGEAVCFFVGHPGISRKIKVYPFAP